MKQERYYKDVDGRMSILDRIKKVEMKKGALEAMGAPKDFLQKIQNEIDVLWEEYKKGKRTIGQIDLMVNVLEFNDRFEFVTNEYTLEEKKELLIKVFGKEQIDSWWDRDGKCMHCDNVYKLKDSKILRDVTTGEVFVVCPYEECTGSFLDIMPI